MSEITNAIWSIELDAKCPECGEWVNLLEVDDFWDGLSLELGETGKVINTTCPICHESIKVKTCY